MSLSYLPAADAACDGPASRGRLIPQPALEIHLPEKTAIPLPKGLVTRMLGDWPLPKAIVKQKLKQRAHLKGGPSTAFRTNRYDCITAQAGREVLQPARDNYVGFGMTTLVESSG